MTFIIMTFSIMPINIMTFRMMPFIIMTFSIMTFSIKMFIIMTFSMPRIDRFQFVSHYPRYPSQEKESLSY